MRLGCGRAVRTFTGDVYQRLLDAIPYIDGYSHEDFKHCRLSRYLAYYDLRGSTGQNSPL